MKCVQTIAGKMINDQNNQVTAAALRARSKKSDLDLVRENEEKFRFCPSDREEYG